MLNPKRSRERCARLRSSSTHDFLLSSLTYAFATGALWSPVLHSQPGKLMLLYAESTDCVIHKGGVMRYSPGGSIKLVEWAYSDSSPSSFDWSQPRQVYAQSDGDQIPKVLANKLIVLKSGELVLPMWSEKHGSCQRHKSKGSAGVLVSEDKGKTWEKRGGNAAGAEKRF